MSEAWTARCRRRSASLCSFWGGRNRNVFDLGTYVVKIPRNRFGVIDNVHEGSVRNGPNQDSDTTPPRSRPADSRA